MAPVGGITLGFWLLLKVTLVIDKIWEGNSQLLYDAYLVSSIIFYCLLILKFLKESNLIT